MTTRSALVVLGVLVLGVATAPGAEVSPRVDIEERAAERRVDVTVDGQPFTSYAWPERVSKPVLYPIRTARGSIVTRGFPLEPRPGERVDHPHQVGLWFNFGDVNGVDFWNNSEVRTPEEKTKMGTIRHVAAKDATGGSGRGTLAVALEWVMPDGSTALEEEAVFAFHAGPDRRAIDRTTRLTASGRGVAFGDNKEGLFALRVARALELPATRPQVFTDASGRPAAVPVLDNTGVTGSYTSSEGLRDAAAWGTPARWMALSGRIGEEPVVLLILDHPGNPGHPGRWHARDYGLFAVNPFGAKAYTEGKAEASRLSLEAGASALFRHRLLVLSETFSAEKAVAAWKAFAAEPGK
jgi:hypothetical protein